MGKRHVVVETKHNAEITASRRVEMLGYRVYLPLCKAAPNSRGVRRTEALFPRMFFVQIPRNKSLLGIGGTRGVSRIMRIGDVIASCGDADVQRIRDMEFEGFVDLSGRRAPRFDLRESVVWMNRSGGTQAKGIYMGDTKRDRANVLFAMMGREVTIEVQKRELAAA